MEAKEVWGSQPALPEPMAKKGNSLLIENEKWLPGYG